MNRNRVSWLILVYLAIGPAIGYGESPPAPEVADLYAFFDGLGLPEVRNKPYVEVRFVTPPKGQPVDPRFRAYCDRAAGYLLAEADGSLILWTHDWYRLPIGREEILPVDGKLYGTISLADTSRRLLERFRPAPRQPDDRAVGDAIADPPGRPFDESWKSDEPASVVYDDDLDPKTQLLLTAWLCRRTGTADHVDAMEKRAGELEGPGIIANPASVRIDIAGGLGFRLHQRLIKSLRLRRVAWTDVEVQAEWLSKHFPNWEAEYPGDNLASLAALARGAVQSTRPPDEVRRFEAEIARLRQTGGPWKPEHAEYVVYSLRDIDSQDRTQRLDLLGEMKDIGTAALIDHLFDDQPTRWVEMQRHLSLHGSVSIGNACRFKLSQTENIDFYYRLPSDTPAERAEVQAKLRAALLKVAPAK
jgi:hypothetical protein